jgi:hypothetical protein
MFGSNHLVSYSEAIRNIEVIAIAEQHINSFLTDQKILVSAAVLAVIEALRTHPNKHRIICSNDGNYDNDSTGISDDSIEVLSELRSNG